MGTVSGKGNAVKRKRYSRKFQRMAVERMKSCDNIGDLAHELGVGRRCLYKWQTKLDHLEPGEKGPRPNSHESAYRKQVHQLKRLLAEKTMEVDFFKGALQKIEARRQKHGGSGETASTSKSAK
jgi:hypothetical protein